MKDASALAYQALTASQSLMSLCSAIWQIKAPDDQVNTFPRITIYTLSNTDADYADDAALSSVLEVQIDVWSKTDYTSIVDAVDDAMSVAGWYRTYVTDMYEQETNTFQKVLRYRTKLLL
ncbi:MAG: hypothetical protein K6T83_10800 [Alicyclobacillus sp.]|nr:hypothetical protein [Alicyclobacillus sp.]